MTHAGPTLTTARTRLIVSILIGLIVGGGVLYTGHPSYALLATWDSTALVYVGSVLCSVLRYNADATKRHALAENPGRAAADILLLITSVASLVAVGVLLLHGNDAHGIQRSVDIGAALFSIIVSWSVVHTLFMLRYARLYYGEPEGGIDFNDHKLPAYSDFAYLAFTVGMTFQVSDTVVQTRLIRAVVLRQALLAYVFGTVIIAVMINTVASLSSGK